jgi:hypothetical protein
MNKMFNDLLIEKQVTCVLNAYLFHDIYIYIYNGIHMYTKVSRHITSRILGVFLERVMNGRGSQT